MESTEALKLFGFAISAALQFSLLIVDKLAFNHQVETSEVEEMIDNRPKFVPGSRKNA
jgi:hypothetical protein